jgi:hypothetical protein
MRLSEVVRIHTTLLGLAAAAGFFSFGFLPAVSGAAAGGLALPLIGGVIAGVSSVLIRCGRLQVAQKI